MKLVLMLACVAGVVACLDGKALAQSKDDIQVLPDSELKEKYDQAMNRKNYAEASEYVRELVRRYPKQADYCYKYGEALLFQGNLPGADAEFEKVLEIDSDYLEAYLGQAIIYARQEKEKPAKDRMLDAARKGYPVREMQKVPELRRYLAGDVRFFLVVVESDIPRVEQIRDPFVNPLRKKVITAEGGPVLKPVEPEGPVGGDPDPIQRDKMYRMKQILVEIQQHLAAGEDDQARLKFEEFKALYKDVEVGRITKKEYKEQMLEAWKVAQETVYPRLRQIELRKFRQDARVALDILYDTYKKQNIEAARLANIAVIKVLEPKQKSGDPEFEDLAGKFDKERADLFEKVKILEEFQVNIRPFLKLTGTITSPKINIAMIESAFGGEISKANLKESDPLPRMEDFIVLKIEEDRVMARYKGEQVEILLGGDFGSVKKP